MIDFSRIAGFDWDTGNSRKSADKHSVEAAEAEQVFIDARLLITDNAGHSQTERRYRALGETLDGRRLYVTFTLHGGGTVIRVISTRDMNRRERAQYEKEP